MQHSSKDRFIQICSNSAWWSSTRSISCDESASEMFQITSNNSEKKSKRLWHIKNNKRLKITKSNNFRRCNNNRENKTERNRKTKRELY
jgi:DNA polymerase III delta prime subunit